MKTPRRHIHLIAFILILLGIAVATVGIFSPREAYLKEPGDSQFGTPNPPTNLIAAAASASQINLSWQPGPSGEFYTPDSFIIYRTTGNNLNFAGLAPYATVPSSQITFSDNELTSGVTYNYKVAAKNGNLESENSSVASAIPAAAPTMATNVTASALNSSQIQLNWDAVSGATSYKIYRKSSAPTFSPLTTVGTNGFIDSSLSPETTYSYYVIASNSAGDGPSSAIVSATTPATASTGVNDTTPPQITNVVVDPGIGQAQISWQTDELADALVQYGTTQNYGKNMTFGRATAEQATLSPLQSETIYYFKLIATDASGNRSEHSGNFTTKVDSQPLSPPTDFQAIVSGGKVLLSWKNPTGNSTFRGVRLLRKSGTPSQTSADGDLLVAADVESFSDITVESGITYFYTAYSFDNQNAVSAGTVVMAHLPSVLSVPTSTPATSTQPTSCNIRAIDCTNPACFSQSSCKNLLHPTTTPPTTPFPLRNIQFLVANRTVQLSPASNGTLQGLPGRQLIISIPRTVLTKTPKSILLTREGIKIPLRLSSKTNTYEVETLFPSSGSTPASMVIDYGAGMVSETRLTLSTLPLGRVSAPSSTTPGNGKVQVTLFSENGQRVQTNDPVQTNPVQTTDGSFGWLVPNGRYYLTVSFNQLSTTTPVFIVNNNIVNQAVTIGSSTSAATTSSKVVPTISMNELTEKFTREVVSPISVALVVLGLLTQVSLFDILALLRLLFLQPILLIRARKRDAWGEVYNSLNKLPVDLAIVRLIDKNSKQILQTRVTGKSGRYFFSVGPGNYQLEVIKDHMQFPSELLLKAKNDGRKTDLYHGEALAIKDQYPVIAANIPVDPKVEEKSLARLHWERLARFVQVLLSISGVGVTGYSIVLTPGVFYLWALLVVHVIVLAIFMRLAIPKKPKGWGSVKDSTSERSLGNAVAKLYNTQYNRLVDYVLTDRSGRYYFLAGDSTYQIRFEKPEYKVQTSREIDVRGKEEVNVAVDVGLEREDKT